MKTAGSARRRFERQIRFLQARLSPEGFLGLHLTIGLLVIVGGAWWFSEIAEEVSRDPATRLLDDSITSWFVAHATAVLTSIFRVATFFGSVGFVSFASIVLALVLALRRNLYRLLAVTLAVGGGALLNLLLKHFFHRARPVLENPLVTLSSYGFPSGHTMGATLFYGLLALLAWNSLKTGWGRIGVLLVACLIVVLIALTRIYLGAHFLTDVIGAVLAGVLWLTVCWTAMETLRRRRSHHGTARGRLGSGD